jgi:carbonic anhydrase/acetyltransferase-like protein (isoleucine patch superfamily)
LIAAIIIADYEGRKHETRVCTQERAPEHWACVDVLGRPVIGRLVDGLKRDGINAVFVVANGKCSPDSKSEDDSHSMNVWAAAGSKLDECRGSYDSVLIADCGTYAEFEVGEMLAFHQDQGGPVTQAVAADGPVDLWIIDPVRFHERDDLRGALTAGPAPYEQGGYVNRLRGPRDFRQLVSDSFNSRCRLRPCGVEVRPSVWMGENAGIGRGTRIVAPAFIGQQAKIGDDCLITRGTNVECNSHVDFGTAAENSSILPNTYLGIGLDLSHSIVDGRYLWNLRHDVTLEITDPAVMRPNAVSTESRKWSEFQNDAVSLSA